MANPILVVTADTHVEYNAYAGYPAMCGDSYHALSQVFSEARELRVPVVIAGDAFDKNYPDSYSLKQVFDMVRAMKSDQLPVFYVQGQHEMTRRTPWLALTGWACHLHNQADVRAGRHSLTGLDWLPAADLQREMKCLPAPSGGGHTVLVCHQVWQEFMSRPGVYEGSLDELVPDHVRVVITGDFHGHRAARRKNANGVEYVVLSPGSTTLQSVSEDPNKYFWVLDDDLTFRSVAILNRPVFYSRVPTDQTADAEISLRLAELEKFESSDWCLRLPGHLRTPMWVVQYHESVADAPKKFRAAARDRFHLFLRVVGGTPEEPVAPERPVNGLEEALGMVADRASPVYSTALRLLGARDHKAELSKLVEELLKEGGDDELERAGAAGTGGERAAAGGDGLRPGLPASGGGFPVEEEGDPDPGSDFRDDVLAGL